MGFANITILDNSTVVNTSQAEGVTFDDPPGHSSSRWKSSLFDREVSLAELTNSLQGRVNRIQVAGTCSGAYTGESFEILLIVLSGIGGGILGAVGKDIWEGIKKIIMRTVKRGPRRALVEVALEFRECDVILHVESRSAREILNMFDDADEVLEQMKLRIGKEPAILERAQTIEIRTNSNSESATTVLHSYRRARFMMDSISREADTRQRQTQDAPKPDITSSLPIPPVGESANPTSPPKRRQVRSKGQSKKGKAKGKRKKKK